MAWTEPSLTVGIEEEYLLVDRETRNLVTDPHPDIWLEAGSRLDERVSAEMLKAQLEVGTRPHSSIRGLAEDLSHLRRTVSDVAAGFGAAVIASSTHPFAHWWEQQQTEKDRYQLLAQDLGIVGRRVAICGMHVHVGVEDPELRIDLMNQVTYFLPHLLTLSTSSPFWGGRDTKLKSYRMNVFRTMPRTGLPEHFDSWAEYQRHVEVLVGAGIIDDASKIWWDIRPSARYPTLELRISDLPTKWEDAVMIAALYRTILHMLFRLRASNQRWRQYANMLVAENVWRAQRYGIAGSLMDYGISRLVPVPDLVDEMVEMLRPDAEHLGCVAEVERARVVAREGTSAERQLEVHRAALEAGATPEEALKAVVDHLIAETVAGA